MAGEDFFKFNKSNEFRFSNYKEIKEEDLKGTDEKTKKLFNIFAGDDKILQEVEAKSLFNVLKSAAGDNQVLEDNEIKAFAKEHIGEEVDTNALMTFVNNIFGTKEKPQTQAVQNVLANAPQKQQTFLEEAACKEIVIDIIDENLSEAYEILNSQYLGSISGWHDERKDKNDILKTSNVSKVLDYQNAGIEWMNKAKLAPPNGLTKKEYYEGNKQRIKDMILTRVLVLDTNTKFKELKNKYSEEKLAQIIGDYVEQLCSNASMEDLKDIQKQFVSYSGVEEIQALENVVDNAIKFNADKNKPMPYSEVPLPKFDNSKGIVPEYWNSDEPISFEKVYKIERGTEYSQYKIEQYALAKKEMEVVANAYNKKQQFIEFAEGLRKDETLNIDEKTQKVLEGFATYYALAEDGGLTQLKELIAKSKLPISIDENGFNFGTLDDNAKNRALNSLLKLAQQSKEKEFEEFLNGKTIEDYQIVLAQAHDEAIGDENGKMMAEAMKNDNLTCIQRWTGNTSMAGMGMTIVGGILCFTPLAPLGAGMITVGNTLAIGGMVAKTGLGVTDYATKDVQTAEEAEQLTKDFIMDAGGFIIGMGAGKAGLKAFSKLIDKKLVAVFGQQIAAGNKMQALKTVFTNPEYLKNFMTAAGAKLSADFVISYAGDLAMMGILDTQDDWQSLLKANLTGILVGMSGDIKDVSGVGRPRNFGISDGVKPMTEMDYGQRLLGNDVTVADPKIGATVEGTVTGLYSQDGQVEIEVNGQRYSTNDVAEVKGEAKVETTKTEALDEKPQITTPIKSQAIDITKLKIEDASIDDLKAIHKIDIEAFKDSYLIDSNFDDYKIDLEEQGISTYAIKSDNGDVIGYYQFEPVENGELYIYSIGVRSDLRNTKASYAAIKQMQESITKFAQEDNIEKVVLDVDASKPELVKLYKKFGFEITAEDRGVEAGHEYHDYRMEINVKKALDDNISKVESSIPAITTNNSLTRSDSENIIKTILLDNGIEDEKLEKIITALPDDSSAEILAKYLEYCKETNNDHIAFLYRLNTPERISEFTELIKEKGISKIPPAITRVMAFVESKEELNLIIDSGYMLGGRLFDIQEFEATMDIKDPKTRENLLRLCGSKLFANVRWYELYQIADDITLKNLDRIDGMMDKLNRLDKYPRDDAHLLLTLSNEELDVIEKRGLLKNIEGRERKLSASDVNRLSRVDDKTWEIIKQRNLLHNIELENANGKYNYLLDAETMIAIAELTDAEFLNIEKRNLFNLKDKYTYDSSGDKPQPSDIYCLAKMDDEIFREFEILNQMTESKSMDPYGEVKASEKRFTINECIRIATASEDVKTRIQNENLLEQTNKGRLLYADEILKLASLDPYKKALINSYLEMKIGDKSRFSPTDAEKLANLSKEELKILQERHLLDVYTSSRKYSEGEVEGFTIYQILDLIEVPQKTWEYMEKSSLKGKISNFDFAFLKDITDEQWERAFKDGLFPIKAASDDIYFADEIKVALKLADKNWDRYINDIVPIRNEFKICSFSYRDLTKITSMEDKTYQRFKEVMTKGRKNGDWGAPISIDEFLVMVKDLDDVRWERIKNDLYSIEMMNTQLSTKDMRSIAELNDVEYARAIEIIKGFQSKGHHFEIHDKIDLLLNIVKIDENTYKRVKAEITSDFIELNLKYLSALASLDVEQYNRLNNEIQNLKINTNEKFLLAGLSEEKYNAIKNYIFSDRIKTNRYDTDNKISVSDIISLTELEPKQFERVKTLLFLEDSVYQIQYNGTDINIASTITDEMVNKFKKDLLPFVQRYYDGEGHQISEFNEVLPATMKEIVELLNLPEEQYNNALKNLLDINETSNNINKYNVMQYLLMDRESFTKIKDDLFFIEALGSQQLDGYDLAKFLELSDMQYDRCLSEIIPIAKKHFDLTKNFSEGNPILYVANLSAEEYLKFKKALPILSNIKSSEISALVKLSDTEIDALLKRNIAGTPLSFSANLKLSKLSDSEYESIKNILIYFDKNLDSLKHQDMDVTRNMVAELIVQNKEGVLNIVNLIGEPALRHASELRYKGLKQLLENAKTLDNLSEDTKNILKSKLEQLPHPEQKLSKLEVIAAISGKLEEDAILEIANKISNPKMTTKQKELADEIFSTNKPYEEQINDFIRAFNVPKERESQVRKFLLEQKLNEKYVTPPSAEEQIAIIDKKIQSIISNDKIPMDKKQAYLNQLEQQKANIIAHPEEFTKARINDRAIKPLEAQVEAHINLPNQNKEFTKSINEQIYKILKIDITEALLTDISYDSKYISKIFGGVSDKGFKNNFNELIELIKANPNKKFTDIIRNLPHNIETKELFEANGLDFDRWITFDATSKQPFTVKVDVEKAVRTASFNLRNELNSELAMRLDQNEIAKLIQILEDNNIDTATQKDLPKIMKLIEKELETNEYWKGDSPDIKTFKDHIKIHKKNIHDVEQLKDITEELYVRLWDNDDVGRNIFFGNHVGCCTSVGSFNSFAAPQHLTNSFVNGIEIVDKSGNSMGNSMCYFAKVDGQLTFVIDSFEANGKLGASPEVTDAIIAYAKKVCAEMGQPNANIMFGPNYNKIDFTRCIKTEGHSIEVIGKAPTATYIDAIGGCNDINNEHAERSMHEIVDL